MRGGRRSADHAAIATSPRERCVATITHSTCGGASGEAAGVAGKHFADRRVVAQREQERPQRSAAGGYARVENGVVESERATRLRVERRGIAVATNRTRDRREAGRGVGRGEQLGGGVKRRDWHAATLAVDAGGSAITPLRTSSIRLRRQRATYSRAFHSTLRPRRTAPPAMISSTREPSG